MIPDVRNIARREKVSSQEQRDFDDRVLTELSNQYHRTLALTGRVKTLSTCLSLTTSAVTGAVNAMIVRDPNVVVRTAFDTPVYPAAATEYERAERVPEFGQIIARRIATAPVFVDDAGEVLSHVDMLRTSNNALFLEKPDRVVENSPFHVLTGEVPYLARFMRDGMGMSNIGLSIVSRGQPFEINAVRFTPMPALGAVSLDSVRTGENELVTMNGGLAFVEPESREMARTFPAYVHFVPVVTSNVFLSFSSELYSSALGSVVVGCSRVTGELNVYALTSYIGFAIDFPAGTTKLTEIGCEEDAFSPGLNNIQIRIYDAIEHFDAMDTNYVVSCDKNIHYEIPYQATPLYVLIKITSVDNTTPCISTLTARFE